MPVHDQELVRSAIWDAPRFKRSSETSTKTTLNASCNQGLPKPEGRVFKAGLRSGIGAGPGRAALVREA